MRDHLLFHVNDRRCQVNGEMAFASLSDFLRAEMHLPGTKVVCAEGDCGACTVLVGRLQGKELHYETVDSCILFLYQLDGKHVVTVEGLHDNDRLHPVQQAMTACHGSQCGYCTPGFVMALTGLLEGGVRVDPQSLRLGLTGNLCRCTGYMPIIEAGLSVDPREIPSLAHQYSSPAMLDDLRAHISQSVLIQAGRRVFFSPRRLQEALDFKNHNPNAVIVSGNTELGVLRNKRNLDPPTLLSLTALPDLAEITCANGTAVIGANVTWSQLEQFAREALPEFYRIILRFGSPQIRSVSTLAGNVANGSPIADALPLLYIMGAEVELARRGSSRRVRIDQFYRGYKQKDLAPDEIITHIHLPLPGASDLLRLYKVSRRNDLDIATFGAGIRIERDGDHIRQAWIAYSGVAPTVVRLSAVEDFLQGRPLDEETFAEAGRLARAEIDPITDVRGSSDYRLQLAENILRKFYLDCTGEREAFAPCWDGDNGRPLPCR